MAVNIDTVYQKVLAIANKEQRGYITPQEFNLFANQAQMEIFEQYFYDLNQFRRLPGNDTEYADMVSIIEEKIAIFENSTYSNISNGAVTFPTLHKLGSLFFINGSDYVEVERVSNKDLHLINSAPLTAPTAARPIYVQTSATTAQMYPKATSTNVTVNYIAKPATVKWTYVVINNKAIHNSSASDLQNFELHASEENELVVKILQLAGISIKDYQLVSVSSNKEVGTISQEKQ